MGCRTGHKDLSLLCQISQVLKHVNAFYLFPTATLLDSESPKFLSPRYSNRHKVLYRALNCHSEHLAVHFPVGTGAVQSVPPVALLSLYHLCSSQVQPTSSLSRSLLESLPTLPRHDPHPTYTPSFCFEAGYYLYDLQLRLALTTL